MIFILVPVEKWTLHLSLVRQPLQGWLLFCTVQEWLPSLCCASSWLQRMLQFITGTGERISPCWETSWLCRGNTACRGQNSEVLFLLTFFCGLWWPLCLVFFLDWVFCLFGSCKFSLKQECYFAVCSAQRPPLPVGLSRGFVSHVAMLCIVRKAKQTNPERRTCFWFEGSFAHKYLFDFRKLQFVTKEVFGCRFPHTSRFSVFLFFFPASKWFRKRPFPNEYFAMLTKVVGPRTFVELTLEAGCLLSIETSWIWWQDS